MPPMDLAEEQELDHTADGAVQETKDKQEQEPGRRWLGRELEGRQRDHTMPELGAPPFQHTDWRAELPLPIGVAAAVSVVAANIAAEDTVHTEELGLRPEGQQTDRGSADRRQTFSNRISSPGEMTGSFNKGSNGKKRISSLSSYSGLGIGC